MYWGYNPFTNILLASWDIQVVSYMMTPVAPFLASYPGLIHFSLDQIHHGFCHPADMVYLQADMEVSSFVLVGTTSAWAAIDLPGS